MIIKPRLFQGSYIYQRSHDSVLGFWFVQELFWFPSCRPTPPPTPLFYASTIFNHTILNGVKLQCSKIPFAKARISTSRKDYKANSFSVVCRKVRNILQVHSDFPEIETFSLLSLFTSVSNTIKE